MEPRRYQHSDELIDEIDATLMMFGRMIAARHFGDRCHATHMDGPRLIVLRLLSIQGPLKAGDLAQQLGIKAPATTALLDALETDGLVARERSADDRRVTLIHVTEQGLATMREADTYRRERMRDYLSVLPEEDIQSMIRIQRTLMASFAEDLG